MKCQFCDQAEIKRNMMSIHHKQYCKQCTRCTKCGTYVSKHDQNKLIGHECIESLKTEIQNLVDNQDAKEIEFKEELRKRDNVIDQLMTQQRTFTKQLEEFRLFMANSMNRRDSVLRNSEPMMNIRKVSNYSNDPSLSIDDESDFYTFYDNNMAPQDDSISDEITDRDSLTTSGKSDSNVRSTDVESLKHEILSECLTKEESKESEPIDESSFTSDVKIKIEEEKDSEDINIVQNQTDQEQENIEKDQSVFEFSNSQFQEKLSLFQEMSDESKWKKATTKQKVTVYTYIGENNLTGLMGVVELPYSYEAIMATLSDPENLMEINNLSEHYEIVDTINNDLQVMYMRYKGFMMVSGREFVS